jgi:hypothetical protein
MSEKTDPGIRRETLVGHGLFETSAGVAIGDRTLEDRDVRQRQLYAENALVLSSRARRWEISARATITESGLAPEVLSTHRA